MFHSPVTHEPHLVFALGLSLSVQDISMLSTLLSSSVYHEVRVNAAGMLGLVGSHVKTPAAVEGMGRALAEALGKEAHVMVEAEVRDACLLSRTHRQL